MAVEQEVTIRLNVEGSPEASSQVNNFSNSLDKQTNLIKGMPAQFAKLAAGYAAVYKSLEQVIALGKESINEFLAADKVQQQVNQSFGEYADAISKAGNEFEKATGQEAEAYMRLAIAAKAYGATNSEVNEIVNKAIGLSKLFELQGVSQETAMKALVKAQQGQFAGLEKIYPKLKLVSGETEKWAVVNDLAAKGMEKANAYTDTFSGKIDLVNHAVGNLKEAAGQQLIQSVLGDPQSMDEAINKVDKFTEAFSETGILQEYIQNLIEPVTRIFGIFEELLSVFSDGDEDINGFAIILEGLVFLMERATLPLNIWLSAIEAIIKLFQGDFSGALKSILGPIEDMMQPLIDIGKELGILSDDFELFGKEATGSVGDVNKSVEKFANDFGISYKKIEKDQETLLEASEEFSKQFIGLTEDEQAAVQKLTLDYRKGVQDRIDAYIKEVGIWQAGDTNKLNWLKGTLSDMKNAYDKDLAEYKKLNADRLDDEETTNDKILLSKEELLDEYNQLHMSQREYELNQLKKEYEEDLELADNNAELIYLLTENYLKKESNLREKYRKEDEEKIKKSLDLRKQIYAENIEKINNINSEIYSTQLMLLERQNTVASRIQAEMLKNSNRIQELTNLIADGETKILTLTKERSSATGSRIQQINEEIDLTNQLINLNQQELNQLTSNKYLKNLGTLAQRELYEIVNETHYALLDMYGIMGDITYLDDLRANLMKEITTALLGDIISEKAATALVTQVDNMIADLEKIYYEKTYSLDYKFRLYMSQLKSKEIVRGGYADVRLFTPDDVNKIEEQIKDLGAQAYDSLLQIRENNFEAQMDSEKTRLEDRYNYEMKLAEDNQEKQAILTKKYQAESALLEKEQAEKRKKNAIGTLAIDLASSLGKIFATYAMGLPATLPAIAAFSALAMAQFGIQMATVRSQKFKYGGVVPGNRTHEEGGQMVEAEGGEGFISKSSMGIPVARTLASIANQMGGGVPLSSQHVQLIDYDLLASKINDKKVYVVNQDIQDGLKTNTINRNKGILN